MGNTLQQLGSAIALSVALAGAPNTTSAQSTQVVGQTQEKVEILLAQASVEKQEYIVYVRQVDANGNLTDKTVEVRYTKNERGVIVPPDTKGGKLLDGRDSTGDAVRDRATNRQIIGQYDKTILASLDRNDLGRDALIISDGLTKKINQNVVISKEEFLRGYYAHFILDNFRDTEEKRNLGSKALSMLDLYTKKALNLTDEGLLEIKKKAKEEAQRRWQSVTRSLG